MQTTEMTPEQFVATIPEWENYQIEGYREMLNDAIRTNANQGNTEKALYYAALAEICEQETQRRIDEQLAKSPQEFAEEIRDLSDLEIGERWQAHSNAMRNNAQPGIALKTLQHSARAEICADELARREAKRSAYE